jgi:antitoxin component YwqK of YwqJK toxin-antitoxin module
MIRVTSLELDYPGDGVTYLNGERFTGFQVFRDEGGWECAEVEYRDGLLSGVKREWHRPGVLGLEAECALGVFHGRVRRWHESGLLTSEAVYEHGIRLKEEAWDESGKLIENYSLSEPDPSFGLLQAFRRAEAEYLAGGGGDDS